VQENPKNKVKNGTTTKSLNEMTIQQLKNLLDARYVEYNKNDRKQQLVDLMVNYYYFKKKARTKV
jgi:hypothetical protein